MPKYPKYRVAGESHAWGWLVVLLLVILLLGEVIQAQSTDSKPVEPKGQAVVSQKCRAYAFSEKVDSIGYEVWCPRSMKLVILP